MKIIGYKKRKIYTEFISKYVPNNINVYIEPFAGSFSVSKYISESVKPNKLIYNDINKYDLKVEANIIHHLDYKEIFKLYDSSEVTYYMDPPYFKKEHYYDNCEEYTKEFHNELCEEIKKLKGKVILSYENNRYITDLYKDFNIYKYDGDSFEFRNEILITNFK